MSTLIDNTTPEEARAAGYEARSRGYSPDMNPYAEDDPRYKKWVEGFEDCHCDFKGSEGAAGSMT